MSACRDVSSKTGHDFRQLLTVNKKQIRLHNFRSYQEGPPLRLNMFDPIEDQGE